MAPSGLSEVLQRRLASPSPAPRGQVQAKLEVSDPGDALEIEADRVADQVMRMPEPGAAMPPLEGGSGARVDRACAACSAEDELQRTESGTAGDAAAPPIVHDVLGAPGRPLDPATRAFMEPRFGHDFAGVRIHDDARAAASARAVNALAYTHGSNIVFDTGQYAPDTAAGQRLLAHELAHTIQQGAAGDQVQRACDREEIGTPVGCTPDTTVPPERPRYLFDVRCDTFARGNELDLQRDAESITAGETVEIRGMASQEGPLDFNIALSCARALRARDVIQTVLRARGITATLLVFSHGPQGRGSIATDRAVAVVRRTPPQPQPEPPQQAVCGPDVTAWFLRQITRAKSDPRVLAIKADLDQARRWAPWIGYSTPILSGSGALTSEGILEDKLASMVEGAEAAAHSPPRTPEASAQIAAAGPYRGQLTSATARAPVDWAAIHVGLSLRSAGSAWSALVGHGGPYDFKAHADTLGNPTSEHCPVECPQSLTLCPAAGMSNCYNIDMPGNIFYAHIGRFVGFSENVLQLGSQYAQLTSPGGPSWDPPEDTRLIHAGFILPDPLSRADLCAAVNGGRAGFDPRACADCPEVAELPDPR